MIDFTIKDSNIQTAWELSNEIEEFENPYPIQEYNTRLSDVKHKILMAFVDKKPVGFKIGYHKSEKVFYSWMGGVLSKYRRNGIARALADIQESWARDQGYEIIEMKTRNIHKRMLIFALSNGFQITKLDSRLDPSKHRIYLEKRLQP